MLFAFLLIQKHRNSHFFINKRDVLFFLISLNSNTTYFTQEGGWVVCVSEIEIEKKLAPFIGLVLVAAQVLHLHLAKYRAKPSGSVKILHSLSFSYTPYGTQEHRGIRLR